MFLFEIKVSLKIITSFLEELHFSSVKKFEIRRQCDKADIPTSKKEKPVLMEQVVLPSDFHPFQLDWLRDRRETVESRGI